MQSTHTRQRERVIQEEKRGKQTLKDQRRCGSKKKKKTNLTVNRACYGKGSSHNHLCLADTQRLSGKRGTGDLHVCTDWRLLAQGRSEASQFGGYIWLSLVGPELKAGDRGAYKQRRLAGVEQVLTIWGDCCTGSGSPSWASS